MSLAYKEYTNDVSPDIFLKRIRIYTQYIYKNKDKASEIERIGKKIEGVECFKANPLTGNILILYDESATNENTIKKQIYRYVSKQMLSGKVTDIRDTDSHLQADNPEISSDWNRKNNTFPETVKTANDKESKNNYHSMKIAEVERSFDTHCRFGLTKFQSEENIKVFGLNVLSEIKRKSLLKRFFENLNEFSTRLLAGVGLLSCILGQVIDGAAILGIAAVETILSTLQQHKAEKSLHSLKKMMVSKTCVLRDGKKRMLDAKYLVPGDVILIEAGEKIPADARLIECCDLKTSEAMLTGESTPVCKSPQVCRSNTDIADRNNMIYMGTGILSGRGKAIVTATGKNTEIGKIADMLQNIKNDTAPIQAKIKALTTKITKLSIVVCLGLSALGLFKGASFVSVLVLGISFAIGAIPESMPAVVTAAMALSVQKMASKNAIVRKLPAIETLGSANVICCDKTGTLTMNEMTVKEIVVDNKLYALTGSGYNPQGKIKLKSGDSKGNNALEKILTAGILCNNSNISNCEGRWTVQGDPTEGALLTAARKNNMQYQKIISRYPRVKEIPFDSAKRYMTVLVSNHDSKYAFCKGSLSKIMDKCTRIYEDGKERLFTSTDKMNIQSIADSMGADALRVLAFCYKKVAKDSSNIENNFTFLGLTGMEDPPREEVKDCIKKCQSAGIKVVMITGDNKNTAAAIGKNIGLLTDGIILSGPELDTMSEDALYNIINKVQVFARTSPEQKYKIVKAFKRAGNIVAMTGDGVNDAPAIKEADIGIAMGANGSDVARDTADIILTDDNFASIVAAIEEGRAVNRNIKNSLKYLLSGCLSEMIAIGIATIFTGISPFVSMQILWINVIAETILGSSLTLEAPSQNIMSFPPVARNEDILDSKCKKQIIRRGLVIGLSTYFIFQGSLLFGASLAKARTLAFTNIILSQIINVYSCKSNRKSKNKYMNLASFSCLMILAGILYNPLISVYFSTKPLLAKDVLILAGTTTLAVI